MSDKPTIVLTSQGGSVTISNAPSEPPAFSMEVRSDSVYTANPPFSEIRDKLSDKPMPRPRRLPRKA